MTTGSNIALRNNNLPVCVGSGLVAYFEQIKKFPMLSEAEETELLRQYQEEQNMAAAQKLVTSHLRLAAKIAMTYKAYGLPLADLVSEANLGLMQAVKKFDLGKKVRLATYAIWWIRAFLNDYILRSWSLVKIGTKAAQKKLFYNLSRIKARLGLYENKELDVQTVKQISQELSVSEADVKEMNVRLSGDSSLNVTAKDDSDTEIIDVIADGRQNLESNLISKDDAAYKRNIIKAALSKLTEREQNVIKSRMLTENPLTLEQISMQYNISRERVRQIEKIAFEKLSALVKQSLGEESWTK